jgi:hypothetical protein
MWKLAPYGELGVVNDKGRLGVEGDTGGAAPPKSRFVVEKSREETRRFALNYGSQLKGPTQWS